MKSSSLVRAVYLYLFSMLGLSLLVLGGVRFLDMALKIFIFRKAEAERILLYKEPPSLGGSLAVLESLKEGKELSESQRALIENWLKD